MCQRFKFSSSFLLHTGSELERFCFFSVVVVLMLFFKLCFCSFGFLIEETIYNVFPNNYEQHTNSISN